MALMHRSLACFLVAAAALATPLLAQVDRAKAKPPARLDPVLIADFGGTRIFTKPSRDAVMGFSLPTQVREVIARGGAEVKKGDMLIKGDDAEDLAVLELQKPSAGTDWPVQRAKKTAELAQNEYIKTKKIFEGHGSNDQELERAKLSMEAAILDTHSAEVKQEQEVLQIKRLQARVDKFHLTAPFDGIVDNVMVDAGQAVNENEKVIRVVNIDPLWIDVPAPIDDDSTRLLKKGDKAWVLVDVSSGARIADGTVIEASPTSDFASRSRRIRVELPNPPGPDRLLSGLTVSVRFAEPSKELRSKVAAAAESMKDRAQAGR